METNAHPKVSIIIPTGGNGGKEVIENVIRCAELDYPDYEILLLPDAPFVGNLPERVKVFPTDKVSPPEKRDLGISRSQGEILAFLDSDAYPRKDWLKNAVRHFGDDTVAAVGGPAVTPPRSSFREKAGGLVFSSPLASGEYTYRYTPEKIREVDDYPSCNFIARKATIERTGGFNVRFWPGEDTILCLKIIGEGKKIIYDPEVLIFHYRRPLFLPHLRQVGDYALHRGYFVKKFPGNSFHLCYFMPSLLVLGAVAGAILSGFFPHLRFVYFGLLGLYLLTIIISSLKHRNPKLTFLVSLGIILTHFTYGIRFLRGFLARRLKEE